MRLTFLAWGMAAGLVLAGALFLVLTRSSGHSDRDELEAFANRMDSKLALLDRKCDSIRDLVPQGQYADSCYRLFEENLALCRELVESVRRQADCASTKSMQESLAVAYNAVKSRFNEFGNASALLSDD